MMKSKEQKLRAQVKSRWSYTFWGTATIAVVWGQIYVGTGYRKMATSFDRIVETVIVEFQKSLDSPKFY